MLVYANVPFKNGTTESFAAAFAEAVASATRDVSGTQADGASNATTANLPPATLLVSSQVKVMRASLRGVDFAVACAGSKDCASIAELIASSGYADAFKLRLQQIGALPFGVTMDPLYVDATARVLDPAPPPPMISPPQPPNFSSKKNEVWGVPTFAAVIVACFIAVAFCMSCALLIDYNRERDEVRELSLDGPLQTDLEALADTNKSSAVMEWISKAKFKRAAAPNSKPKGNSNSISQMSGHPVNALALQAIAKKMEIAAGLPSPHIAGGGMPSPTRQVVVIPSDARIGREHRWDDSAVDAEMAAQASTQALAASDRAYSQPGVVDAKALARRAEECNIAAPAQIAIAAAAQTQSGDEFAIPIPTESKKGQRRKHLTVEDMGDLSSSDEDDSS